MFDLNALRCLPGPTYRVELDSPAGPLTALLSDAGVQALLWQTQRALCAGAIAALPTAEGHPVFEVLKHQIDVYFDRQLTSFHVPLDLHGTPFQKRVWALLQNIPFGETRTYGDLALMLGDANLSRAVGAANGNNPVSILVPCHRVIGSSGALTGYAGGKEVKAFLLALEGVEVASVQMDLFGA